MIIQSETQPYLDPRVIRVHHIVVHPSMSSVSVLVMAPLSPTPLLAVRCVVVLMRASDLPGVFIIICIGMARFI